MKLLLQSLLFKQFRMLIRAKFFQKPKKESHFKYKEKILTTKEVPNRITQYNQI